MRRSGVDDALPLFEPIKTQSGTLITHVPLPEGTNLVLSFAAYNRYVDPIHHHVRSLTVHLVFQQQKDLG